MSSHLEALWDKQNDWSLFTLQGSGDLASSWVQDPVIPYRGGAGRLQFDLNNPASPSWSWSINPATALTANRFFRWSGAFRIEVLSLNAGVNGLFYVSGQNTADGDVGIVAETQISTSNVLSAVDGLPLSSSIKLDQYANGWILFDFRGISRNRPGDASGVKPFKCQATLNFWLEHGRRPWPIGGIAWDPDDLTDVEEFHTPRFGIQDFDQRFDDFTLYVDEFRLQSSDVEPASALPLSRRLAWPTSLP